MSTTVRIIILSLMNVIWAIALIGLNNYWSKQVTNVCEMARRHNKEWYEICEKQSQDCRKLLDKAVNIIKEYREVYEQISQQENND